MVFSSFWKHYDRFSEWKLKNWKNKNKPFTFGLFLNRTKKWKQPPFLFLTKLRADDDDEGPPLTIRLWGNWIIGAFGSGSFNFGSRIDANGYGGELINGRRYTFARFKCINIRKSRSDLLRSSRKRTPNMRMFIPCISSYIYHVKEWQKSNDFGPFRIRL